MTFSELIDKLNGIAWGPWMLVLLGLSGVVVKLPKDHFAGEKTKN